MHVNDVVNKKNWKGNKIMERICILAFLGINSWKDIRTREVSLLSIGVFGIVGMVRVCFLGKEAHAGGAPWNGVNALNAATLAIQARWPDAAPIQTASWFPHCTSTE